VIPRELTPAILEGDVGEVLARLPDESIQCVVTSPPYWGLRDYGLPPVLWGGDSSCRHSWAKLPPRRKRSPDDVRNPDSLQAAHAGANIELRSTEGCVRCGGWLGQLGLEPTPELYVNHLAGVFDQVRRVLRSDGTLWLNLGDTFHTDSPVRRSSADAFSPNWDPSQTRSRGGARRSASRHGQLKPKDLAGIPWRVAFELQRRGWWLRSDCVWAKRNPMPESVLDRPTRSHEYVFLLTKSKRYFYDGEAVREPVSGGAHPRGGRVARKLATPGSGTRSNSSFAHAVATDLPPERGRNLRSVWWIATRGYSGAHFATFPEALPDLCIRAGTSERGSCAACGRPWAREVRTEGGSIGHDWYPDKSLARGRVQGIAAPGHLDGSYRRIDLGFRKRCACRTDRIVPCLVLDPFAGSGTVLAAARRLGRRSIGIDLNPEYVEMARHRSSAVAPATPRPTAEASA
jgi:DNA modification methylase